MYRLFKPQGAVRQEDCEIHRPLVFGQACWIGTNFASTVEVYAVNKEKIYHVKLTRIMTAYWAWQHITAGLCELL